MVHVQVSMGCHSLSTLLEANEVYVVQTQFGYESPFVEVWIKSTCSMISECLLSR
jgi:hypothetical protein